MAFLRVGVRAGRVFRPHSSKGMRLRAWLPAVVTRFFQFSGALESCSQATQVSLALVVSLSRSEREAGDWVEGSFSQ